MIEFEYSFKVQSLDSYIKYCKDNNYTLTKDEKQIRYLYKKDNTLARITVSDKEAILDYKKDSDITKVYKEAEESKPQKISYDEAIKLVTELGFTKYNELERRRVVYSKGNITYELDEYLRPEKSFVVAIEGDKKEVQAEYQKRSKYYRFTYNGLGIYEAVRQSVDPKTWQALLQSPKINWLPKPNIYEKNNKSYFTKKGYDIFTKEVKPLFSKYLDINLVNESSYIELTDIIYEDEYQVITK